MKFFWIYILENYVLTQSSNTPLFQHPNGLICFAFKKNTIQPMLQIRGNRSRVFISLSDIGGVASSFQGFSRGGDRSHPEQSEGGMRRGQFPPLLNP
jgi:hypothetical protein